MAAVDTATNLSFHKSCHNSFSICSVTPQYFDTNETGEEEKTISRKWRNILDMDSIPLASLASDVELDRETLVIKGAPWLFLSLALNLMVGPVLSNNNEWPYWGYEFQFVESLQVSIALYHPK